MDFSKKKMFVLLIIILCLMVFAFQTSNGKYCTKWYSGNSYFLSNILQNCTFIDGSITIEIEEYGIGPIAEVLDQIEYVTGFVAVIVRSSKLSYFSMKKLKVIYGNSLTFRNGKRCSLYFESFSDSNIQLDFRSLTAISNGWVLINSQRRPTVCHAIKMIKWNEFFDNADEKPRIEHVDYFICDKKGYNKTFECHKNCPKINGTSNCFGPEEEQCQKTTRCTSQSCPNQGNRCYIDKDSQSEKCCHSLCRGGCFNSTTTGCYGCVGLIYNGECVETCPIDTYKLEGECVKICSKGSYKLENACLDSCPKSKVATETECVGECPDSYTNVNGICTKCEPADQCPKTCKLMYPNGEHYSYVDASKLAQLKDCEYIVGSVIISALSFRSSDTYQAPIKSIDDFMALSKVKRIDGVLQLQLKFLPKHLKKNPKFKSAFFLQNLEEVNGIRTTSVEYNGVGFFHTPFHYLGLKSLKKFSAEKIGLRDNTKLKFIHSVNWTKLGVDKVDFERNSQEDEPCHASCHKELGCMGPGPEQCLKG